MGLIDHYFTNGAAFSFESISGAGAVAPNVFLSEELRQVLREEKEMILFHE